MAKDAKKKTLVEVEIGLKVGGVLKYTHWDDSSPHWALKATLIYEGVEYPLGAGEKLSIMKARATRKASSLGKWMERKARFQSGLPLHVADDVKPEGALL